MKPARLVTRVTCIVDLVLRIVVWGVCGVGKDMFVRKAGHLDDRAALKRLNGRGHDRATGTGCNAMRGKAHATAVITYDTSALVTSGGLARLARSSPGI
jgi:hypothetical protein